MDIIYSKQLESDNKNTSISAIEYLARERVDNGDDENSNFENKKLHEAVVEELKRRAIIQLRAYIGAKHDNTKLRNILRKHGITRTSNENIIQSLMKKDYKTVKAIVDHVM